MNKKAAVLVLVCIVSVVLIIMGSGLLSRSISENNISKSYIEDTQSFWLAESGVQYALRAINSSNWGNWTLDAGGNYSINQTLGEGSYQVTISDVSTANPKITSSGVINTLSHGIDVILRTTTNPIFTHAAYGKNSVTMTGNGETDSYNSDDGAYGGANVGSNGDVGTNGTSTGAIALSGNATVNGDVETGSGGTITTSGNAEYTGDDSDGANKDLTSVDVEDDLEDLFSSGSMSVGGNSSDTISAGDYKYSSIQVKGNGDLYIDGEVRLYLTGSSSLSITGNGEIILNSGASLEVYVDGICKIAGNGITNNDLPENLLIYSTYSGSGNGIKIAGNGDLIGAVYAPDTDIKITGNGDVFGAVVGETVSIPGNGDVHYDEALADLGVGTSQYEVQAWIEQNNPYSLN